MFPNDEGIISLFFSLVFSCSIFLSHLHYSAPLYSLPSIICYFAYGIIARYMIFKILITEGPISNASFIHRCHLCGVHICWTEYLHVCIYGNKLIWRLDLTYFNFLNLEFACINKNIFTGLLASKSKLTFIYSWFAMFSWHDFAWFLKSFPYRRLNIPLHFSGLNLMVEVHFAELDCRSNITLSQQVCLIVDDKD